MSAPETPRTSAEPGLEALKTRLFEPISNASLVFFRVAFGGIMLWEVFRYFDHGWITRYWVEPAYNFTYPGFGWVSPLPETGMLLLFVGLGMLALFIMVGLFYRVSTTLFFLGFTYTFLLEHARYLNHFYLVILISFLIIFLPLAERGSLDAYFRKRSTQTAPAWTLWLIRFQIGVVYFFGGIAKLNADWLIGEPMRTWMGNASGLPLLGGFIGTEPVVLFMSYFGLLFDLFVVAALLWRPTRVWAYLLALSFHLSNAFIFSIGIFPWFMIAATAMFFAPDWPERVRDRFLRQFDPHHPFLLPRAESERMTTRHRGQSVIVTLLCVWVLFQVLFPLRHLAFPGNVSWTEEGHNFSWHMKLRSKSGYVTYIVTYSDGSQERVEPDSVLESWQVRKMAEHPHMILQFAGHLKETLGTPDNPVSAIHAHGEASLNARPPAVLIDPFADLTQVQKTGQNWIMPIPRRGAITARETSRETSGE